MSGLNPTGVPDQGTDVGALAEGYVSITPLHLDLTDYRIMDQIRRWAQLSGNCNLILPRIP